MITAIYSDILDSTLQLMHKHMLGTTRLMPSSPRASEESEMISHLFHYSFCLLSDGMERPFGHFKASILTLFPLSSLSSPLTMALALYNTA